MNVVIQTKWGKCWGEVDPTAAAPAEAQHLAVEAGFTRYLVLRDARSSETGLQSLLIVNQEDILSIGVPDQKRIDAERKAQDERRNAQNRSLSSYG